MAITFLTNSLYTSLLTISFFTTSVSLLKSVGLASNEAKAEIEIRPVTAES